jgi:hypothetical protein
MARPSWTPALTFVLPLLLVGATTPAAAQTVRTAPRRVEIGANVSGIGPMDGGMIFGGPQIAWNITSEHALVVGTDLDAHTYPTSHTVHGIYLVQYRYRLPVSDARRSVFATVGGAGMWERHHNDAYSYTVPGYTRTVNGQTQTVSPHTYESPERTRWEMSPPMVLAAGLGGDLIVARWLGLRGEFNLGVGLGGIAGRLSGGVFVPLGGHSSKAP